MQGIVNKALLVALGREPSHEAVVCQHAGADSRAAGSGGIAEAVGTEESIPKPPGGGGV